MVLAVGLVLLLAVVPTPGSGRSRALIATAGLLWLLPSPQTASTVRPLRPSRPATAALLEPCAQVFDELGLAPSPEVSRWVLAVLTLVRG